VQVAHAVLFADIDRMLGRFLGGSHGYLSVGLEVINEMGGQICS